MFGDVWHWVETFRNSARNTGVDHWDIQPALRTLLDDVKTWIGQKSYRPDEIAVRFHHRLVQIHPFPNGNDRHSRLMADLLIAQLGGEHFSWRSGGLSDASELRGRYIDALHAADAYDIGPLLTFARS